MYGNPQGVPNQQVRYSGASQQGHGQQGYPAQQGYPQGNFPPPQGPMRGVAPQYPQYGQAYPGPHGNIPVSLMQPPALNVE